MKKLLLSLLSITLISNAEESAPVSNEMLETLQRNLTFDRISLETISNSVDHYNISSDLLKTIKHDIISLSEHAHNFLSKLNKEKNTCTDNCTNIEKTITTLSAYIKSTEAFLEKLKEKTPKDNLLEIDYYDNCMQEIEDKKILIEKLFHHSFPSGLFFTNCAPQHFVHVKKPEYLNNISQKESELVELITEWRKTQSV